MRKTRIKSNILGGVLNFDDFIFKKIRINFFRDFDSVRQCVNKELEQCSDSTPANIVDALLKFLKKQMPCTSEVGASRKLDVTEKGNSSVFLTANFLLVSFIVTLSSFIRF